MDDFLSDIAFFNGKCYSCSFCDKEFDCPTNLTEISSKVNEKKYFFCSNLIRTASCAYFVGV